MRCLIVLCTWLIGAASVTLLAEGMPMPEVVKPAVADVQSPAAFDAVKLTGFLGERMVANEKARLLTLDEDLLLDPFRKRPGPQAWAGEHVGKWLHAATMAWVNTDDPQLRAKLDRVASELMKTQLPDGYLGTYLPKDYWTNWDVWVHKYDLMGLLTYYRYTGDEPALEACKRIGDLLCNTFGQDKRDIIKAGEHVGMAPTSVLEPMVLLYRQTGDAKYLEFCRYILWAWDQPHGPKVLSTLAAGKGVNEVANNKAYEMLSDLVGVCELYRTTGDKELLPPVIHAWEDIVAKRLYITGSASQGEHFRGDYVLPNDAKPHLMETCVTVTWIQLNAQLLRLTGDPRYADQIERTAYNHLAGAQLPSGEKWCYYTALEGQKPYTAEINCCASSGPRGMALLPSVACTTDADGVVVNFYEPGTASLVLADGRKVRVELDTRYPVGDKVTLRLHPEKAGAFVLKLRVPQWSPKTTVAGGGVTGADTHTVVPTELAGPAAYRSLKQSWKDGDTITVQFEMPLQVTPGQHSNQGKVVVTRGPLILAADESTNPERKPILGVAIPAEPANPQVQFEPAAAEVELFSVLVPACTGEGGHTPTLLKMVPFANVGNDGSAYGVWFPQAEPGCGK